MRKQYRRKIRAIADCATRSGQAAVDVDVGDIAPNYEGILRTGNRHCTFVSRSPDVACTDAVASHGRSQIAAHVHVAFGVCTGRRRIFYDVNVDIRQCGVFTPKIDARASASALVDRIAAAGGRIDRIAAAGGCIHRIAAAGGRIDRIAAARRGVDCKTAARRGVLRIAAARRGVLRIAAAARGKDIY